MEAPAAAASPEDDVATEKRWLVGTYLPSVLPSIKSSISEAQDILSFPAHSVKLVSFKSPEYALTKGASNERLNGPSGGIQGAYRLAGATITEAEIAIRHAPEKKTAISQFNTEINTSHPYHLHQLQDATNHLALALSAIEELSASQNLSFMMAQMVRIAMWRLAF